MAAKDHLLKELRDGVSGRFMVCIHGMGGLGKTTLARKLYNELAAERFHCAWICVSQSYTPDNLLQQLIKTMLKPRKQVLKGLTSRTLMKDYLWDALSKSSFVVVLDDVWDKKAWESVSDAFPNDSRNGRVIITTRNSQVANANPAHVHELKGLDYEDSWELFCRNTFQNDNCPSYLKQLGEDMVRKCDGLPLAIVTLGRLLSTKSNNISEWEAVKSNIWEELDKKTLLIDAVLSLSFNDLPYDMKPCLLYVAMFPEDYEIPIAKLILLWEAEGFASREESKLYFDEIVGRSLLQKNGEDWLDSTCRVHDLVRDLAIKKAKEASFSRFYGENEEFDLSDTQTQRRLAMHNMKFKNIPVEYENHSLRTMHLLLWHDLYQSQLSCFNELLQPCHGRFDKLRVLDVKVEGKMPSVEVGKLIHLRYLGLESRDSFKVSKSLGDLKLLQTLYVAGGVDTVTLPKTVEKLQNLKHLLGLFGCRGAMGVCIGKLTGLKTLEISDCFNWCHLDTANLVNLQHLSVGTMPWLTRHEERCNSKKFLPNFDNLKGLRTINLKMESVSVYEVSEILKSCPLVTHFKSWDNSKNPGPSSNPDLFEFGTHLEVIQWEAVRASNFQATISSLEKLPRLRALQLSVKDGEDLILLSSEEAFPQLQTLYIRLTTYFHPRGAISMELSVKESAMSLLRNLYVDVPDNLKVPDRLKQKILTLR